jgi:hypothetical protein
MSDDATREEPAQPGSLPGTEPGNEVFTAADLEPSDSEKRAIRRMRIDKAAAITAVLALGTWAGGMLALGACAAPFVFQLTPAPWSGYAMGAAFARFDSIAIACSVLTLGAEVVRTLLVLKRPASRAILPRLRRYAAIVLALGAVYIGMHVSPTINQMHEQGVRRNVGPEGIELERIHKQAELIGKITMPLALALAALHIATLRTAPDEDDEEEEDLAPRPVSKRAN